MTNPTNKVEFSVPCVSLGFFELIKHQCHLFETLHVFNCSPDESKYLIYCKMYDKKQCTNK